MNHRHVKFINKQLLSNPTLKSLHKLRNSRSTSFIKLPKMKNKQEVNNSKKTIKTFNSTIFFFNKNKYLDSQKITDCNNILNFRSIEDFLGKTKDPLEKQKELYEYLKEEKLKIKTILSNLISWDNEPTAEEIESFKMLKLDGQKKAINNYKNYNKGIKLDNASTIENNNNENEIGRRSSIENNENNKIFSQTLRIMRPKVRVPNMAEKYLSKGSQIKEQHLKLLKLKFSVFDKDYDPKKFHIVKKKTEKDKKKEEEEKINQFKEKDFYIQYQREQRQIELIRRDEIAIIYKNIIINKLKKKKYIELLDQTYLLLDKARTEYSLSVDILKERIKSVKKYYNAFIVSVDNPDSKKTFHLKNISLYSNNFKENDSEISKKNKMKKKGLDIYEEKIKKYREYLMIMDDLNKEIENYDQKFELIQNDLNSLLKICSDRIDELTINTRQLKYTFKELNNQQTQYYLNILKKGVDTRTEGLSWVVKRLMELNIPINSSIFPGFLDQEQIDYLIQISKLGFESAQLKQILDNLRNRQSEIKIKEEYFGGFIEKEIEKYTKPFNGIKIFNLNLNSIDEIFKEDTCNTFKSLNKLKNSNNNYVDINKTRSNFKSEALQNILEDIQIKSIVENLKHQISKYSYGEGKLTKRDNKKNNIINYLLEHDKNKDYFQDVITLSDRIKKLNEFIKLMRKEEFLIFEEKSNYGDLKDIRAKYYYDKIFNALFGSSSLEFSGSQKSNLLDSSSK